MMGYGYRRKVDKKLRYKSYKGVEEEDEWNV
jgi:hypothetical protein